MAKPKFAFTPPKYKPKSWFTIKQSGAMIWVDTIRPYGTTYMYNAYRGPDLQQAIGAYAEYEIEPIKTHTVNFKI